MGNQSLSATRQVLCHIQSGQACRTKFDSRSDENGSLVLFWILKDYYCSWEQKEINETILRK